jgi:1-deoxy-D-xylulose-5-phosphate synthase
MAMGGLRPVVAVYSTFLTRAIDQLTYDVGLHGLPVVFCLDRAGITGDDGPSHHGVLDMALVTKVPGLTLFAPSSYQELGVMLHDALELCEGPAVIRWSKTAAPQAEPDEVGSGTAARKVRQGRDLCILAVGKLLAPARAAADALAAEGIEATVWDVRVVPLDPEMIADATAHPVVLTAEDGIRAGGVGSLIADAISQHDPGATPPRVRVLGTPTAYIPQAKPDAIHAELGLDAEGLAAAARELVAALRA